MENMIELNRVFNRKLSKNNELELNIFNSKEDLNKILINILKRGIDYCMKSLNINENNEGIIKVIKKISNSKEFKEIIDSSVNISISQFLENKKEKSLKTGRLNEVKEAALKGGIRFLLTAGIDILFNKNLKLNLFKPIINSVLKNFKDFILSNSFIQKLNKSVNSVINKADEYLKVCKEWYKAYEKFDVKSMNELAKQLENKKTKIQNNENCLKENNIIQNMTKLVNSKKDKLSNLQLQICNDL